MRKIITNTKKLKAFTLVETLLYMALFGTIFVVIIQFAANTGTYNADATYRIEVEKALVFINEHIAESIKQTKTIDTANSTFNNSNGKLTLTTFNSLPLTYTVSGGRINLNNNGTNSYISGIDYSINSMYIEKIVSTKTSAIIGIRVTLTITSNKQSDVSKTTTTAYLLNTL